MSEFKILPGYRNDFINLKAQERLNVLNIILKNEMLVLNTQFCDPPLSEREVLDIVASVWRKHAARNKKSE